MSETFTFEIGGVPTDDPWGRWRLAERSQLLPAMGSVSVTSYRAPGQQGETQSVLAPRDPQEFPVQVIFYPVEAGQRGKTPCERLAILTRHIDTFQQAIRAAAQESMGLIRLRKTYSGGTPDRRTAARIISDSIDYRSNGAEAVMTLLLRVPSGVWVDPTLTERSWSAPAGSVLWAEMPVGPAGMENLQFAVQGRQDGKTQSLLVRNEAGTGFQLSVNVPAGQWLVLNCESWRYKIMPDLVWGTGKDATAGLLGYGRGTGKALNLFPSSTLGVAKVSFRMQRAGTVALRGRKAYY